MNLVIVVMVAVEIVVVVGEVVEGVMGPGVLSSLFSSTTPSSPFFFRSHRWLRL